MVRETGLEPVRHKHTPLKRACLPIPALALNGKDYTRFLTFCQWFSLPKRHNTAKSASSADFLSKLPPASKKAEPLDVQNVAGALDRRQAAETQGCGNLLFCEQCVGTEQAIPKAMRQEGGEIAPFRQMNIRHSFAL